MKRYRLYQGKLRENVAGEWVAATEAERLRAANDDVCQQFLLAALRANDGPRLNMVIDAAIGQLRAAEEAERKGE